MIGENKILLMKFNGGTLDLEEVFDSSEQATHAIGILKQLAKINNDITGIYYLLPAQEIKIIRE